MLFKQYLFLSLLATGMVCCKKEVVKEEPFVQRYPGIMEDAAYGAAMAPNGEMALVTSMGGSRFAMRLKANGEMLWRMQIPSFDNQPTHTVCDADGYFYVMGNEIFGGPKTYAQVLKLGDNGNPVWNTVLSDSLCNWRATDMVHLDDRHILVSLQTEYCAGNDAQMLFKINYDGKIVWTKTLVGQYCLKLAKTADEGFLFVGYGRGIIARKFDKNGNIQWEKALPFLESNGKIETMKELSDGSIHLVGRSVENGQDVMFSMKLSSTGETQWYLTKNYLSAEDVAFAIEEDLNGNIYLGGVSRQHGREAQGILVKMDRNGQEIWHKLIGGTNKDWACSLFRNSANEIMVFGNTWSFQDQTSSGKVFIMRMDENGEFH